MARRHPSSGFPYADRARAVEAAREARRAAAVRPQNRRTDAQKAACREADQNIRAALDRAYPPDFWSKMHNLKSGDLDAADAAIEFLEADPMFFGSGYAKAKVAKALCRATLRPDQRNRLVDALLHIVDRRKSFEYRELAKLASKLADQRLISELKLRRNFAGEVGGRADWILKAIERSGRAGPFNVRA